MKKKLRSYRVALHGHSPESDGLSTITELVKAAGRAKIDFFGLADHETVAGVPSLYREVASYNRSHEHQIQAVAGVEIKLGDSGDVIFSKPGPIDESFLSWIEQVIAKRVTYKTVRAINQAVRRFGALVTIPHVGAPMAGSVSAARLEQIVKKLSPRARKQVVVEVRNYATQVFSFLTIAREEVLERRVDEYGLAKAGFSDYHESWMIKKQVSTIIGIAPTVQALKKAIRHCLIKPAYTEPMALFEWFRLVGTLGRAFILYKKKHVGWWSSLPAFRPEPAI